MNIPTQARLTSFPSCALARSGLTDSQGDPSPTTGDSRRHFLPLLFPLLLLFLLTSLAPSTAVSAPLSSLPDLLASSACTPIAANTTWTSGVYTATDCNIVVPAGVTLTIQAGAVVKLGGVSPGYGSGPGSAALIVHGGLVVAGDAGNLVIFTSLTDDSRGGDSNSNGPSSGAAGDWYGIVFAPGSRGRLENFFVGYSGSGTFNAALGMYSSAQILIDGADVEMRQGEVADGLQSGVSLKGGGIAPVLDGMAVRDNRMTNGRGYAIYQSTINMQPTYSNLTFSGNDRDEVTIGRFSEAMTQDVVLGGTNYGFVCGYTVCLLTVANGTTLTIQPSTLLDFRPSFGIAVADGGSLIAQGTATQPITFTSRLAEAADGASQHWIGLWAQQGSTLRLDQCDISYASDTNFGLGGLEINTDDAQVRNCHIHHNAHSGLYIYSRDASTIHPTLTNVDVTDNGQYGVYLDTSYGSSNLVTWDGGRISRNGWAGMSGGTWFSSLHPTLRDLTISDNGSLGGSDARRRGINLDNHGMYPVLDNITLTGNTGAAMLWYCNGSIQAHNLTATGNGADELQIPGCSIGGGQQWDLGDVGIPVRVTGSIEVTPNALLSIMPGSTLGFDKNSYGSPTYLEVQDQAALYALGTAEKPVVFTGAKAETGWWAGIAAENRATITLRNCEIAYGGATSANNLAAILNIEWGLSRGAPAANIQNCEIHHSGKRGVYVNFNNYPAVGPIIFQNNSLHDIAGEVVLNYNAPVLDARENWWGNASGPYHATLNPTGQGSVGDNIIFYPWLGAPDTGQTAPGQMLVSTGAPSQISPGETVDYAIQYLNQMTQTLTSAILMLQLPEAGYFVESTAGALYWPDRHQVVWKLGDLAPGADGFVTVRVRFQWGLAADYADGSLTQFAALNYNAGALDVAGYNAYESTLRTVTDVVELNAGEFATVLDANPDLETLYQTALGEGFQTMSAARITYADGMVAVNAALRTPDRKLGRIISLSNGRVLASTVGEGKLDLRDLTGGMVADLNSQTYEFWGGWIPDETARAGAACTENRCFFNCMLKAKSWGKVARKLAGAVSWVIPPLGAAWTTYEVYDEITTYQLCKEECKADPTSHCCTPGEIRHAPTGVKQQCAQYSCDALGTWRSTPDITPKCGFGERCVAGPGSTGGCKACEEDLIAARFVPVTLRPGSADSGDEVCTAAGTPRCSDLTVRRARDPNAIYGPAGDLLPGTTALYTITYENEGAGQAFGVYVVNVLPTVFDPATLNLHGAGTYLPASREIVWSVGKLEPKGVSGSEGMITYTVALTGGLPSGTVVSNQAVVFFPSVPEETPTNTWVNLVSPLKAVPQSLTTAYMTPLDITLTGQQVTSGTLTYEIAEAPHGGLLAGTAPSLIYTPLENFTGPDSFDFRVSNGTSTSRAAQVRIEVTSVGDATPPQVLWTSPAADATAVTFSDSAVYTDSTGPVFTPVIRIGLSEPLDETTVTTGTISLADNSRGILPIGVVYDGGLNQIVVTPRQALAAGRNYTLSLSTGVTDRAGNPLAGPVTLRFTTATSGAKIFLPAVAR